MAIVLLHLCLLLVITVSVRITSLETQWHTNKWIIEQATQSIWKSFTSCDWCNRARVCKCMWIPNEINEMLDLILVLLRKLSHSNEFQIVMHTHLENALCMFFMSFAQLQEFNEMKKRKNKYQTHFSRCIVCFLLSIREPNFPCRIMCIYFILIIHFIMLSWLLAFS